MIIDVVAKYFISNKKTLSVAESCSGGYLSHRITSFPGSSEYFKGGIIAYSDEVKNLLLGVDVHVIKKYGAVSEQVVISMSKGTLKRFKTDYAVAISGIAGPGGAVKNKPVGTVCIAVSSKNRTISKTFHFGNAGRIVNIEKSANASIAMLIKLFEEENYTKKSTC